MRKLKVLIADATDSIRQFVKLTLMDHFPDIEISVASSGKNIKQKIEISSYDLIICERELPMLGGDELLEWLRTHESLKHTPVIIISLDRYENSIKKAISLGANGYLIKPLLAEPLVNKVKEITGR
jgi:two-component system chemotaxis response regulator CheY